MSAVRKNKSDSIIIDTNFTVSTNLNESENASKVSRECVKSELIIVSECIEIVILE